MTQQDNFDAQRVDRVYEWMVESEALAIEATNDEQKTSVVEHMVNNLESVAESAQATSEKTRRSRVTRAMGQRTFMLPYIKGSDVEELRDVIRDHGWSLGQDIDGVAKKVVKSYSRLLHSEKQEFDNDGVALRAPSAQVEKKELVPKDLDDKILTLKEAGIISPSYAGYLRLLFGTANVPTGTSSEVYQTALGQARTILRIHISKTKTDGVVDEASLDGIGYIRQISRGSSLSQIAKFIGDGTPQSVRDNEANVRTSIAYGLEVVYGSKAES